MARSALAINSLTGAGFCEPLENGSSRNLTAHTTQFRMLTVDLKLGILHSSKRRKTGVVAQKRSNSDEYCILPTTLGAAVEVLDCCITSVVSLLTGVITAVFSLFHRPAAPKYYNCPPSSNRLGAPNNLTSKTSSNSCSTFIFFSDWSGFWGGRPVPVFSMIWDWLANEISWTI